MKQNNSSTEIEKIYSFLNQDSQEGILLQKPFFNYTLSRVRNYHDAEEIMSQVQIKILGQKKNYHNIQNFEPWLYRTVITTIATENRGKNQKRKRFATLDGEFIEELGIEENYNEYDDKEQFRYDFDKVQKAMENIKYELKEVLIKKFWEGKKYSDIANEIGCAEGTAKTRTHRAIGRLRFELGLTDSAAA